MNGPLVLICDHATNFIPPHWNNLGVAPSDLVRHIAWDIGAAGITTVLSEIFDSPAIYSSVSRLVIDCNRHLDAQDLIPAVSDGTPIPGNSSVTTTEKSSRIKHYFDPYHNAIESVIEKRNQPITVSVHSMTARLMDGPDRPWHIALSSFTDRSITEPLLQALKKPGDIVVGDNQPYDLDPRVDYSTPFHALRRGLRHIQVEFRQDLIGDSESQSRWAYRFASALKEVIG